MSPVHRDGDAAAIMPEAWPQQMFDERLLLWGVSASE
jgi:hypothetical protein